MVIDTVMSFMYSWFLRLQLVEQGEKLEMENYEALCNSCIEMINEGAITIEDIVSTINSQPDQYAFDCIMVDESQDWPQGEVDILKMLYGPTKICLADGVDQLLRGERPDWDRGVSEGDRLLISLDQCLRMKRNLAIFAHDVSELGGYRWDAKPNKKAGGGKVKILLRPYECYSRFHDQLLNEVKDKGNDELDFLHCVPSSNVLDENGVRTSKIGAYLLSKGYEVWDGVDARLRRHFPRSKKQFRIVQYASCRGLEGWAVVLHFADQYWEESRNIRAAEGLTELERLSFEDLDEVARSYAWQRSLIPLTRPIDTLIISLSDVSSEYSLALLQAARNNPDFVEIMD